MTMNRTHRIFAQLAITAALALTAAGSLFAASNLLYEATTATLSTGSQTAVPITGLTFDVPAETTQYNAAIITLNLPDLYLSGTASSGALGGQVSVLLSGVTTVAVGEISADARTNPGGTSGRKPLTIVVRVGLLSGPQSIQAQWNGVRNSTVNSDTFGSISAILVKD